MAVRGGQRLKRLTRQMRERRRKLPMIEVGYKDRRIAALAATHEFGLRDAEGKVTTPERPAFRDAKVERAAQAELKRIVKSERPFLGFTHAHALRIGQVALGALRDSYESADYEPVGERQQARKRGTAGAGRQLVGSRGPKMIGHLGLWIDGVKIE